MRKKLFDVDEVLDKSMLVFWQYGYDGTSMQRLQDELGLSRASIYHTFTDKSTLFKMSLQRYLHHYLIDYSDALKENRKIKKSLHEFLKRSIKPHFISGCPKGCLAVFTIMELENLHQDIRCQIQAMIKKIHSLLYQFLQSYVEKNRLKPQLSVTEISDYILTVLQGLSIMHRAGSPFSKLDKVIQMTVSHVDSIIGEQ